MHFSKKYQMLIVGASLLFVFLGEETLPVATIISEQAGWCQLVALRHLAPN